MNCARGDGNKSSVLIEEHNRAKNNDKLKTHI